MIAATALMLMAADAVEAPGYWARLPVCTSERARITQPCAVPLRASPEEARRRIADRPYIYWRQGDVLTVVARPPAPENWALLCCTVQQPLSPITGTGLVGASVRVPAIDRATLRIRIEPAQSDAVEILRGKHAPPELARRAPPPERLTHVALPSRWLGEARDVTIYVPPDHAALAGVPMFILADDLARDFAPIVEAAIIAGKLKPVMLVGIAAAPPRPQCTGIACDRRGGEYKLSFNRGDWSATSPYGRHLRFVIDEVIPYVEARYPALTQRSPRIVAGSSNGGDWAFSAAALRSDIFRGAVALSASGALGADQTKGLARSCVFGGLGSFEGDYLPLTTKTLMLARQAGAVTRFQTFVGGHEQNSWAHLFADAAPWMVAALAAHQC